MSDDTCCICLEDINDSYRPDSCKHKFHDSCINTWMLTKDTCPFCRTKTAEVDRYLLDRSVVLKKEYVKNIALVARLKIISQ